MPASPGFAFCRVKKCEEIIQSYSDESVGEERASYEVSALNKAISKSILEIREIKERIIEEGTLNEADSVIFDTHLMMLEDPLLIEPAIEDIRENYVSAEYAYHKQVNLLIEMFERKNNALVQDKIDDIKDISARVLAHLNSEGQDLNFPEITEDCVLVAHGLTPSQVISLKSQHTLGLATDTGGATSHFAIIARSMEIPVVAGLKNISMFVEDGDFILIDGSSGLVIVHPNDDDIKKFKEKKLASDRKREDLEGLRQKKAVTLDGHALVLKANIELPVEVASVRLNGGEGVGLFRSEFLYFQSEIPTEEEQLTQYKLLLDKMHPHSVIIRTLDAGGDKLVKNLSLSDEFNPFMGWRSIRVCLEEVEMFKNQLRALLRANTLGNLRIMFPMICNLNEWRTAKAILDEVRSELLEKKMIADHPLPVGIMVEVPGIIFQIEDFAKEVDFFSIGTNDLIQFSLAVDRTNEKVAYLYTSHHPGVIRMIAEVCRAGSKYDIPVSICGEMAGDPMSIALLSGIGVQEFSMSAWSIPANKKFIRSITMESMQEAAQACLKMDTSEEINGYLKDKFAMQVLEAGANSPILNSISVLG
jgi:phosphotransferase system enzyme I (PtsI)